MSTLIALWFQLVDLYRWARGRLDRWLKARTAEKAERRRAWNAWVRESFQQAAADRPAHAYEPRRLSAQESPLTHGIELKPERDIDSIEHRLYCRGWNDALAAVALQPTRNALEGLPPSLELMRRALQFYANGEHFMYEDGWDTVSGEPANFWCDEAGTATVEDGTIAKRALACELSIEDLVDGTDGSPSVAAGSDIRRDRRTTQQLLAAASLDSDDVSVFAVGTSNADSDVAILVVKGRDNLSYLRAICERQGLLTSGKPVTDKPAVSA